MRHLVLLFCRGVMKKIKKIMSKMPTDPFEAELLALAGGLVGKKDGEEQGLHSIEQSLSHGLAS